MKVSTDKTESLNALHDTSTGCYKVNNIVNWVTHIIKHFVCYGRKVQFIDHLLLLVYNKSIQLVKHWVFVVKRSHHQSLYVHKIQKVLFSL